MPISKAGATNSSLIFCWTFFFSSSKSEKRNWFNKFYSFVVNFQLTNDSRLEAFCFRTILFNDAFKEEFEMRLELKSKHILVIKAEKFNPALTQTRHRFLRLYVNRPQCVFNKGFHLFQGLGISWANIVGESHKRLRNLQDCHVHKTNWNCKALWNESKSSFDVVEFFRSGQFSLLLYCSSKQKKNNETVLKWRFEKICRNGFVQIWGKTTN